MSRLEQNERRYRPIVETAHDGIWMLDPEMVTVFVNPRMATMLGYTIEEMHGRPLLDFLSKAASAGQMACLRQQDPSEGEHVQVQYRRKDGSELWADVTRTRGCGPARSRCQRLEHAKTNRR